MNGCFGNREQKKPLVKDLIPLQNQRTINLFPKSAKYFNNDYSVTGTISFMHKTLPKERKQTLQ